MLIIMYADVWIHIHYTCPDEAVEHVFVRIVRMEWIIIICEAQFSRWSFSFYRNVWHHITHITHNTPPSPAPTQPSSSSSTSCSTTAYALACARVLVLARIKSKFKSSFEFCADDADGMRWYCRRRNIISYDRPWKIILYSPKKHTKYMCNMAITTHTI